jgi:hypothetical protein
MASAPTQFYPKTPECLIVLFDLRIPDAAEELHHARAAWQEDSDIEALDEDHFILIVRPGWVSEAAA